MTENGPIYFGLDHDEQDLINHGLMGDLIVSNQDDYFPRDLLNAKEQFKSFVKEYRCENTYLYRDQLVTSWNNGKFLLDVNLQDLERERPELANGIKTKPLKFIPICEAGLQDLYVEMGGGNSENLALEEKMKEKDVASAGMMDDKMKNELLNEEGLRVFKPRFQLLLQSDQKPKFIRELQSKDIETLVVVPGILVQTSIVEHKAYQVKIRCKKCGFSKNLTIKPGGRSRAILPRSCDRDQGGDEKCGLDPFVIISEENRYQDFQTMRFQELPEDVPTGEMPRGVMMTATRHLCDRVVPGNRVTVVGIYTSDDSQQRADPKEKEGAAVKMAYIQVLGFMSNADISGRASLAISAKEEEEFEQLARDPSIREKIFQSIAPAILSSEKDCLDQVKIAVACLLFGGSTKKLPDNTRLRGDINVLLLGDPGTAKSQILKFAERAAPISVYTSGKGSSAAGLTASVVKDKRGKFAIEGGAMVLADGGVVCIDEFDKMREEDRVAIHEAMEQQTISIAKAGLTTVLNTRTSVLAAANPTFGSWSNLADAADQMEFASTILSRFDLIFLVRDVRDEVRDDTIARHVIAMHGGGGAKNRTGDEDENTPIKLDKLRKLICFCRQRCNPRINDEAANELESRYVDIRANMAKERREGRGSTIPITVRQLEAVVRIAEAFAKMELADFATIEHVEAALRIFRMSTLDAANRNTAGVVLSDEDRKAVYEVEDYIRRMLHIGGKKSKNVLNRELEKEFDPNHITHAIMTMKLRGELEDWSDHSWRRAK